MLKFFMKSKELHLDSFDFELSGFSTRSMAPLLGENKLKIDVLWIKKNDSNIIFISIDTLYIPKKIAEPIYIFLKNTFNIDEKDVIFNATHTHSSPAIEENFYNSIINNDLILYFIKIIKEIFNTSIACFQYGHIAYKTITLKEKIWVSRRKIGRDVKKFLLKKTIIMRPNHDLKVDNKIRLMLIYDQEIRLNKILYNFSCHPVFNTNKMISSDFKGEIGRLIKEKLGIESFFLQGFSGDIRPNFTASKYSGLNFKNRIKVLFNGEIFKEFDKSDFNHFCGVITEEIINSIDAENVFEEHEFSSIKKTYKINSVSGKNEKQFVIKLATQGNNFFLSIPAEVNSKYILELSRRFVHLNIFPLGLADNIISYLPYYSEIDDGGYEVTSATNYNGWDEHICKKSLKKFYMELESDIASIINERK